MADESEIEHADLAEFDEYQALNEKEERDLELMMSQIDFKASNAEKFVDELTTQLTKLDTVIF